MKNSIVEYLKGELERLKTELEESKAKVGALEGELGKAEAKHSRQDERLKNVTEMMLNKLKELEKEKEESKSWRGKWEELGKSCQLVYGEFSGLMKVFKDHRVSGQKKEKAGELESRLAKICKLMEQKFGNGGDAGKPTSSKSVIGRPRIPQTMTRVKDTGREKDGKQRLSRSSPPTAPPKAQIGRRSRHAGKEHRKDVTKEGHFCVCGTHFGTASKLKSHITRMTGEKKWNCEKCGLRFLYSCRLRRHEQRFHKHGKLEQVPNRTGLRAGNRLQGPTATKSGDLGQGQSRPNGANQADKPNCNTFKEDSVPIPIPIYMDGTEGGA